MVKKPRLARKITIFFTCKNNLFTAWATIQSLFLFLKVYFSKKIKIKFDNFLMKAKILHILLDAWDKICNYSINSHDLKKKSKFDKNVEIFYF